MPELRKDPTIGRWVIIATERARRPGNFVDPYRKTVLNREYDVDYSQAIEILAVTNPNNPNHHVKIVEHPKGLLRNDQEIVHSKNGLYNVINGYGCHELVLESQKEEDPFNLSLLDVSELAGVIEAYKKRFFELEANENLEYAFVYKSHDNKNHQTSPSQIIASSILPLHVQQKLIGARRYFDFHDNSVYSDVIEQEQKEDYRVVRENEHFIAFVPYAARFPFEINIFPKQLHCDFHRGVEGKEGALAQILKDILLIFKEGLDDPSYSLCINTAPFHLKLGRARRYFSAEDDFCWHIEITPQLTHTAGFEKGTGFFINAIPPEMSAEYLKEVEL